MNTGADFQIIHIKPRDDYPNEDVDGVHDTLHVPVLLLTLIDKLGRFP